MDETELERRVRAGLERRAEAADVTAPVVDRARAEVARRRRARWGVVAAAAAVVLVLGGVAMAVRDGDGGREQPATDDPSQDALPGEIPGWRTEHWADVAVDVPAEWGYGSAPMRSGGDTIACWPQAMVSADGDRLEETRHDEGRTLGWVGRPILLTDVCTSYPPPEGSPNEQPAAPYVWLGAAVEPGIVEYDGGFVQETVEVNGSTVTVGTYDADLRNRILASARGGELCMSELEYPGADIGHDAAEQGADPIALRVCAYRDVSRSGGSGVATLTYAAELDRTALAAYLDAVTSGGPEREQCAAADVEEAEWVVLELVDDTGGVVRQDVVHLSCVLGIDVDATTLGDFTTVRLSRGMVEPWAGGGIPAIVHSANPEDWMWRYFIGPQG